MSRCTRSEFQRAGLEPEKCDAGPYNESPTAPETDESYWFACAYHSGYIDGYEVALTEGASEDAAKWRKTL